MTRITTAQCGHYLQGKITDTGVIIGGSEELQRGSDDHLLGTGATGLDATAAVEVDDLGQSAG